MRDMYYKDTLNEKMRVLFREKRQIFLDDIPTLEFMNSFPGFSDSKRQQIRAQERNRGEKYANNDLLDYIMQKDEFWMKVLDTAEKIHECQRIVSLIREVLNANPPNPPSPRRVSREYSEGTELTTEDSAKNVQPSATVTYDEQRKKQMKYSHERNFHIAESVVVTQPSDGNKEPSSTHFSSKKLLVNLCKTTEDNEVSKEEANTVVTDLCSEQGNNQETFSNPVVKDRHVEPLGLDESSDSGLSNAPFSSKEFLANLAEHSNESQSSLTVKFRTEFPDTKADDKNLNKERTEQDLLKPVGQKCLQFSDHYEKEEDSASFVLSDTDVKNAFHQLDNDSSQAPEINSLKCVPCNQENCLLPDNITDEIDGAGNTLQSKQCESLQATTYTYDIDQQPKAAALANHDCQESESTSSKYVNCIIISSHNCQVNSKGCTMKESVDRKTLQRRTAQDIDIHMLENINIGNIDNSNCTSENSEETLVKKPVIETIQNRGENIPSPESNLETENEDCMPFPTQKQSNQDKTEYLSGSTSHTICTEVEEATPEISESMNYRSSEDHSGTEEETSQEMLDPNRYIGAGRGDGHTFFKSFLPYWLRFEWNF